MKPTARSFQFRTDASQFVLDRTAVMGRSVNLCANDTVPACNNLPQASQLSQTVRSRDGCQRNSPIARAPLPEFSRFLPCAYPEYVRGTRARDDRHRESRCAHHAPLAHGEFAECNERHRATASAAADLRAKCAWSRATCRGLTIKRSPQSSVLVPGRATKRRAIE